MNSEVAQIIKGLRLTLPSIDGDKLLSIDNPLASFEAHVVAETGKDYWIYSVNGSLLHGEAIVVRASLPVEAENLAQNGLRTTIDAFRHHTENTGFQIEAKVLQ